MTTSKPPPPPEPVHAVAKFELRLAPSVAIGDPIHLELANVDDHDHVVFLPGASNGCASRFDISFTSGGKTYREDTSGVGCGQGIVAARWWIVAKGTSATLDQATHVPMLAANDKPSGALGGKTLPPGKYTVKVAGAEISVSGSLTLTATKKAP